MEFLFLSGLVIIATFAFLYPWITKRKVRKWYKHNHIKKYEQVFNHLYANINGFILSKKARDEKDALEYLYGEIDFVSFIALLSNVTVDESTVFYDLGSGIGKAVIACSMVYPVKKSCGIEIFALLHNAAVLQREKLGQIEGFSEKAARIQFSNTDFLQANLQEATLIFINATAFINPLWDKLVHRLEHASTAKIIITTSKSIKSDHFTLLKKTRVAVSWGVIPAFIYVRKM
ncbi:putative methyltransferases (plasmid) [Legionella adelaidensis]|uniref:Histone-lysine N-methyltransferase, H3 lysine-79 specific n=1 Tax=Legionella adelaidensis TaxID=45056 RepID=A0A0W0R0Y2_9GAMM|nr:methyltransferase [Legionella adelaidensis]KTC64751.1 putative methyltransferase [Legionella adelaidensis]VEH81303.1 putative methyltransferases [Legionella adelaidensis]